MLSLNASAPTSNFLRNYWLYIRILQRKNKKYFKFWLNSLEICQKLEHSLKKKQRLLNLFYMFKEEYMKEILTVLMYFP